MMNWDLTSVSDVDTCIKVRFTHEINGPRLVFRQVNEGINGSLMDKVFILDRLRFIKEKCLLWVQWEFVN